jgi:hypothetical protein
MAINSLIDHIANHGTDGSVTVGANTPAPYASANLTGFVDGTGPQNASKNMAEFYNRQVFAYKHLLESAGMTFDPKNWAQMTQAIHAIANYAANSGSGIPPIFLQAVDVRYGAAAYTVVDGAYSFNGPSVLLTNPHATRVMRVRVDRASGLFDTVINTPSASVILCKILANGSLFYGESSQNFSNNVPPGEFVTVSMFAGYIFAGPGYVDIPPGASFSFNINLSFGANLSGSVRDYFEAYTNAVLLANFI